MKHKVLIKYPDLEELFDVILEDNKFSLELREINFCDLKRPNISAELDFSVEATKVYSLFHFKHKDLIIAQQKGNILIGVAKEKNINWYELSSNQIISFIIKSSILDNILPYIKEDKAILTNCILSDFIRNDYSYNEINKLVKFTKVAVITSFIEQYLKYDFDRIIIDESFLGDIDVENVLLSFHFLKSEFLHIAKIDNSRKILLALYKNKLIQHPPKVKNEAVLINYQNAVEAEIKLKFVDGNEYKQNIVKFKNYIFDTKNQNFDLEINKKLFNDCSGTLAIFNLDERDLMIQ
jgi:hypothetical protein